VKISKKAFVLKYRLTSDFIAAGYMRLMKSPLSAGYPTRRLCWSDSVPSPSNPWAPSRESWAWPRNPAAQRREKPLALSGQRDRTSPDRLRLRGGLETAHGCDLCRSL